MRTICYIITKNTFGDIWTTIFTENSIPFAGSDGHLTEDNNNLNWDGVKLGVDGQIVVENNLISKQG